jgi:hypothetical protein
MVEHTFSLPELEDEWNTWYSGNLRVLLSVPGIDSAQRFRVPGANPPRYMAMYTLSGPEVFDSTAYRNAGGGGANSVRFRPAYQVWVRNLFADIDAAPEVGADQCLLTDTPQLPYELPGVPAVGPIACTKRRRCAGSPSWHAATQPPRSARRHRVCAATAALNAGG